MIKCIYGIIKRPACEYGLFYVYYDVEPIDDKSLSCGLITISVKCHSWIAGQSLS